MPADRKSLEIDAQEKIFEKLKSLNCTILDKISWWQTPENIESPEMNSEKFKVTKVRKMKQGNSHFVWTQASKPIQKVSHMMFTFNPNKKL